MSSGSQRAFAARINKKGSAAEVRKKITSNYFARTASQLVCSDVVQAPDYEEFLTTHASFMQRDPLFSTFNYPDNDLYVEKIRKHPIFSPKKGEETDKHSEECIQLYNSDVLYLNKRYNTAPQQKERLQDILRCSTPEFQSSQSFKDSSQSLLGVSEDDEEEDALLLATLLEHLADADDINEKQRSINRFDSFLTLCSLQHVPTPAIEAPQPPKQPYEYPSHQILIKCTHLSFDLDIEPIWASLSLYDLRHCKKISETFYFDLNSESNLNMLDSHILKRNLSTQARSAIFNITFPCPDIFLVVKLEKVLQGELSEVIEAYGSKEEKVKEKAKVSARAVCQRLGKYRMSFAWTAVQLIKVLQGSYEGSERQKRASDDDDLSHVLNSFKPITITLSNFYKHETDKSSEEDLYKLLNDIKKQSSSNKKIKPVPGTLKLDVAMCTTDIPNVLSPELSTLNHAIDASVRPIKQILEFPTRDILIPHSLLRNLLYINIKYLNFANRQGSARNLAIKLQVFDGSSPAPLNIIYGKSNCAEFNSEAYASVNYHTKTPYLTDEFKVRLPWKLTSTHHILITIMHISCQAKKDEIETVVGYSWLPLLRDHRLVAGDLWLPVCIDAPPSQYFLMHPDVQLPNMRWVDNHKGLLNLTMNPVSSLHTLDESLDKMMEEIDGGKEEIIRSLIHLSSAKDKNLINFIHLVLNKIIKVMMEVSGSDDGEQLQLSCFDNLNQVALRVDANPEVPRCSAEYSEVLMSYIWCYSHCGPFNNDKGLHETLVSSWIQSKTTLLAQCYNNAPFLFQLILKSMKDHLIREHKFNALRKQRFSNKLQDDLLVLVQMVVRKLLTTSINAEGTNINKLNTCLSHFVRECFSLLDRGFVFNIIRTYYKMFSETITSNMHADLTETFDLKLHFLQILSTHEHFLSLNLPFTTLPSISPTSSLDSFNSQVSYEVLNDCSQLANNELNNQYKRQHFLLGIIFTDLKCALESNNQVLQQKAINIFFYLICSHDNDPRYKSREARQRIANLYFPLISITAEAIGLLYNASNRTNGVPSVINAVISGSVAFNTNSEEAKSALTPEATKDLLVCVVWVLKNADKGSLWQWWSRKTQQDLNRVIEVLSCMVCNFEYKEDKSTRPQTNITTIQEYKKEMEEAILGGNSARMKMIRRKDMGTKGADEDKFRWNKDKMHFKHVSDTPDKGKDGYTEKCEKMTSHEVCMLVLDTMEFIIQLIETFESLQNCLPNLLRLLLACLSTNQSSDALQCLFATQRSLVLKFPELLFEEDTEQCADLCLQLLKHASSSVCDVRRHASASLYMLMRQNFEIGNNFARIKMQVTLSLSTLVAQSGCCNQQQLKKSFSHITHFANNDQHLKDSNFAEQVRELVLNLNMILSDTFKMKEYQSDFEMLLDIMHRIAKGYQNSPDLRLTWLENMANKHIEHGNFAEGAQCILHGAGLVMEYLCMLEDKDYLPVGCVSLQHVSRNILEESAVSEDVVSPEEEGICSGKSFTEAGLCSLLEKAVKCLLQASLFEVVGGVYKVLTPIYESQRDFTKLAALHSVLHNAFNDVLKQDGKRVFGTYFRVGFYGAAFNDLNGKEFVYKEPAITKLPEISSRLETFYCGKLKCGVEIIKDSNFVQLETLDPNKAYIQITYVEPYFELYELKERKTFFEQNYNIKRFMYATPFTQSGKPHGGLREQYKRKTVLTSSHAFPYVKTRLLVIHQQSTVLSPIEVATEDLMKKKKELVKALRQSPHDVKMLQMVLQGCIGATVNQGPIEMASAFLAGDETHGKFHNKLRGCFKDFIKKCDEALMLNKRLISQQQKEYQHELERKFKAMKEALLPLLTSH